MLNSIEISLFVLEANNYERKYTTYHKWYLKISQRYEFIHSVLEKKNKVRHKALALRRTYNPSLNPMRSNLDRVQNHLCMADELFPTYAKLQNSY